MADEKLPEGTNVWITGADSLQTLVTELSEHLGRVADGAHRVVSISHAVDTEADEGRFTCIVVSESL
jgi:hypothetical protein